METAQNQPQIPAATSPADETILDNVVDTTPYEKNLKNARVWLYVIAALQTIIGIVEYNTINEQELATIAGLIDVGIAFSFFALALWSRHQPFAAFTTALVIYVTINLASMVLNPSGISAFFLVKIFVVIALVKAINSAREISRVKESMGD